MNKALLSYLENMMLVWLYEVEQFVWFCNAYIY